MNVILYELKRLLSLRKTVTSLLLALLGTLLLFSLTFPNLYGYRNDNSNNLYVPQEYYCFSDYVSRYGNKFDDIKFDERYKELKNNVDNAIRGSSFFNKHGITSSEDISYVYNFLGSLYSKYYYNDDYNARNEKEMLDAYLKDGNELRYNVDEAKDIFEKAFGYKYSPYNDKLPYTYIAKVNPENLKNDVVLFYSYEYIWRSFCFQYQKDWIEVDEAHYIVEEHTTNHTDENGNDVALTYLSVYAPKARIYNKSSISGFYLFDEEIDQWIRFVPKVSSRLDNFSRNKYETILPAGVFFDYITYIFYSTSFILLFSAALVISSSTNETKAVKALKYSSLTGRKYFASSFIAAIILVTLFFAVLLIVFLSYSFYFGTYRFFDSNISSFLNCLLPLLNRDYTLLKFILLTGTVSWFFVVISAVVSFLLSVVIRRGAVALAVWLPVGLLLVSAYYFTIYKIYTVRYSYNEYKTYASFSVLRPNNIEIVLSVGLTALLIISLLLVYRRVCKRDY